LLDKALCSIKIQADEILRKANPLLIEFVDFWCSVGGELNTKITLHSDIQPDDRFYRQVLREGYDAKKLPKGPWIAARTGDHVSYYKKYEPDNKFMDLQHIVKDLCYKLNEKYPEITKLARKIHPGGLMLVRTDGLFALKDNMPHLFPKAKYQTFRVELEYECSLMFIAVEGCLPSLFPIPGTNIV